MPLSSASTSSGSRAPRITDATAWGLRTPSSASNAGGASMAMRNADDSFEKPSRSQPGSGSSAAVSASMLSAMSPRSCSCGNQMVSGVADRSCTWMTSGPSGDMMNGDFSTILCPMLTITSACCTAQFGIPMPGMPAVPTYCSERSSITPLPIMVEMAKMPV